MKTDKLFMVLRDGKPYMSTNYESCVPSNDEIKAMKRAGYKIIDNRKKKETEKVPTR